MDEDQIKNDEQENVDEVPSGAETDLTGEDLEKDAPAEDDSTEEAAEEAQ
jgi:hypothetical protein